MSSLSPWIRDVPLTDEQRAALAARSEAGVAAAAIVNRTRRIARQQTIERGAEAEIGSVSDRELFLLGVAIYWAEGVKAKPWAPSRGVALINSDPAVVRLFLAWLELLGIASSQLELRLSIHESADVHAATAFWAAVTAIDAELFARPTLKRHNPKTVRYNTGDSYVGCVVIKVRRSTDLNRRIRRLVARDRCRRRTPPPVAYGRTFGSRPMAGLLTLAQ
jgi:hypothetical protein